MSPVLRKSIKYYLLVEDEPDINNIVMILKKVYNLLDKLFT